MIAFTARCQNLAIGAQYAHGVRCFDLRLKSIGGEPHVVHNAFDYGTLYDIQGSLQWLDYKGDTVVRVVHDVRSRKDCTAESRKLFAQWCKALEESYPNITFWFGRNLYNWEVDYDFPYKPSCEERYASVCSPRILDDWCPLMYARLNNKKIRERGTDMDILLMDFVEIN